MTHVGVRTIPKKGISLLWFLTPAVWLGLVFGMPYAYLGTEDLLFWLFAVAAVLDAAGFITTYNANTRGWVHWGCLMLLVSWGLFLCIIVASGLQPWLIATTIGTLYVSGFAGMALSVLQTPVYR